MASQQLFEKFQAQYKTF